MLTIGASEQHDPTPGVHYEVTRLTSPQNDRDLYRVVGTDDGKEVNGELTIHTEDGEFNGWDWTGTELTDDEHQQILDLFETEY